MQYYDVITIPRWWMAANMKVVMLAYLSEQESPADAVKPARCKSMQKLLQFDVFRFISRMPFPQISNYRCIVSRGMFSL